jgi:hypothetical protein
VLQQEFLLARPCRRCGVADNRLRNLDYPEAEMEKLRRGERPRNASSPSRRRSPAR